MEYTKLVDVSLCHEYYNGSSCGFKVIPSIETAEILKKEDALCRIYDGKVRLMAPMTAFAEETTLFFYVKASIAEIWNVTNFDGIVHDEFPVAVVSNDKGAYFEGRQKNALPELQRMFGVIFALELHLTPKKPLVCTVKVPTKKLRWCYCVSGVYAERDLRINDSLDADNPVQFDCVEKTPRFSLYVSRSEIPIVSGAPSRFQLMDSATSKVLMKNLPNANAKYIAKASLDDGTRAIVAECFINP
ncbi:hypothetical protein [Fibrobacter sp. UWB12]|uniref:hypothetical protein n=1 Tax=Fibrobacter sp. UWB12 TaxID=1896203 RepID=UPI0009169EBA|nr:hypothetical protein [Fibrobacter sp. UWB12]SHK61569.1 hypothetical protein SAMN05720759_104200 [Fibrobacter sp. UWB12]